MSLSSMILSILCVTLLTPVPLAVSAARARTRAGAGVVAEAHRTAILDSHVSIQSIVLQPPRHAGDDDAAHTGAGSGPAQEQPLLSFEVALFSVHLSHTFTPSRSLRAKMREANSTGGIDDLARSELFPEESESSAEGLTRLVCGPGSAHAHLHKTEHAGRMKFFDSAPKGVESAHQLKQHRTKHHAAREHHAHDVAGSGSSLELRESHVPDVYLLPLDSIDASMDPSPAGSLAREAADYVQPLYELLHPLFGSAPEVVAGGGRLRFALLMNMEWIAEEADNTRVSHLFSGLTEEELLDCSLHFLPESLQTFSPSGVYADHSGKVLRGSVGFVPSPAQEALAVDAMDVEHVFEVARRILPVKGAQQEREQEQEEENARSLPTVSSNGSASSSSSSSEPAPVFLSTSSTLHARIFGELAKSLTTSIVQPQASSVAGSLAGLFFDQVKEKLFQTQEGNLGNEIPNQLSRALTPTATYKIVKSLSQKINAELPDMLEGKIEAPATKQITETLTGVITRKLAQNMARNYKHKMSKPILEMMIPEILLPLGHILTKVLSVGLTPIILHVMDASPHMDYYCYFCRTKQIYCGYCSYAPKQMYYASYYAGQANTQHRDAGRSGLVPPECRAQCYRFFPFLLLTFLRLVSLLCVRVWSGYYSTYYSNYYTRFSVDAFQRLYNPLGYAHNPQIQSMPNDGVEIVLPYDETGSTWKEAERRKGNLHWNHNLRPQEKA